MGRHYPYDQTYRFIEQLLLENQLMYVPLENANIEKFDAFLCTEDSVALKMMTSPERYQRDGATGIHKLLTEFQRETCQHYRFFVQRTVDGPYIGYVDWMLPPPTGHRQTLELGYFVLPSCRREGVATHMVQDAKSHLPQLKAKLGINQISLEIGETNEASLAMAHKLGFKEKGRYVSEHPLSAKGAKDVHFVYGIQRERGGPG